MNTGTPYSDSPGLGLDPSQIDVSAGMLELHAVYAPASYPGGPDFNGPGTLPLAGGMVMWNCAQLLYGTVEVRAKLTGTGSHATVWLFDIAKRPYLYWSDTTAAQDAPANEIDIAEGVPFVYGNTTTLRQNYFSVGHSAIQSTEVTDYSANFHTYKLIWTPTSITWFVDGVQTNQVTGAGLPSDPMMLVFDIETADAGAGDVIEGNFPQVFQIDYAKAWDANGNLIFSDDFDGIPAFQVGPMVQIESYNFATVENPVSDGGNFTVVSDSNFTAAVKAITGNLCEPSVINQSGGVFFSAAIPSGSWPNDQYSEITLSSLASTSIFGLLVRQGGATSATQYLGEVVMSTSSYALYAIVAGTLHTLQTGPLTAASGDVFRLSVLSNVLTLSQNGTQIANFTDMSNYIASGAPGFSLYNETALVDTQISLWAGGGNLPPTPPPTFTGYGGGLTVQQLTQSDLKKALYWALMKKANRRRR